MFLQIEVDPKLFRFFIFLLFFILAATVHEFAHAYSAHKLGDNTAKNQGRLTFNPIKHIDLFGTILMPFISFFSGMALIGWAKPVPVDRSSFKDPYKDHAIVAAAGPVSNIVLAFFLALILSIIVHTGSIEASSFSDYLFQALSYGVFINVFLFLFNLLPIPPLDGAFILFDLFPNEFTAKYINLGLYGTLILILFIYSPLWGYFFSFVQKIMEFVWIITGLR
ncbi:MAG: site-2 protease family protein [Ignavibacteriaceae bacterium]|nr:site-2 protease family protein [Ignavibacteriaceae bacterium]